MQFSSRLPIATHILLVIQLYGKEFKVTSDFLASSVGVNPVIIRKTLGQLKRANLVEVNQGIGGTTLKKSLDQISLLDIFRAVEEDEDLFHFHENPNPNCTVGKNIHAVLGGKIRDVKSKFEKDLDSIKLDSLIEKFKES